jgi:hypothetical protein
LSISKDTRQMENSKAESKIENQAIKKLSEQENAL